MRVRHALDDKGAQRDQATRADSAVYAERALSRWESRALTPGRGGLRDQPPVTALGPESLLSSWGGRHAAHML